MMLLGYDKKQGGQDDKKSVAYGTTNQLNFYNFSFYNTYTIQISLNFVNTSFK